MNGVHLPASVVPISRENAQLALQHYFSRNSEANPALWEQAVCVQLPKGCVTSDPIRVHWSHQGEGEIFAPCVLLVFEAGAEADVIIEATGHGNYTHQPTVGIVLGPQATVRYHFIQDESLKAEHLGTLWIEQSQKSQSHVHLMSLGAFTARMDVEVLLDAQAECTVNGLTLVRDQVSTTRVCVEHQKPQARSVQTFKSILDGQSRTLFDGLIRVCPQAQKTDARQNSRSLLLSKKSQAHHQPHLEILADDVKCSHGASTGMLDLEAEFYLRARGIDALSARALLVRAFAQDSIDAISISFLRERLSKALNAYLALETI